MEILPTVQVYSPTVTMQYHQRKAMYFCKKYHEASNPKRKDAYFKLCIRHSINHEKLEKDEKSF